MLKRPEDLAPECREFQRHYERGRRDDHLETCAECRSFVEFVDGLRRLGTSTPLADSLRERLRGLPAREEGVPTFPTVPQLPLPAALAQRLRRIARQGARELPIWIRSPRYAIAASYLLTLLIGGTLGNPAAWAASAASPLETVGAKLQQVQANGRETWSGVGETAAESINLTKDYLRASASSLHARWTELVASMNDSETTEDEAGGNTAPEASSQGEEL